MPFGFLALLAAFGTLANSLRSNSASVLIRTLLRCSARPNGGGYHTARPLRELRPKGLFASLTLRGLGLPHSSALTSLKARHAVPLHLAPLIPHASLLIKGNHKGCPYGLTPHPSLLTPHSALGSVGDALKGGERFRVKPGMTRGARNKCLNPRALRNRLRRASGVAHWKGGRLHVSETGRGGDISRQRSA